MAISQHGTSVLFTSHPQDRLVVNFYIPHNRRTPLQAEEALGPISIPLNVETFFIYTYILWLDERRRTPLQSEEALGPISIPRDIEMGPRASSGIEMGPRASSA